MESRFLKLDKPCGESWDNMTQNAKGRFCDQCAKTVIDFTVLTRPEIARIMKKNNGNVCARVTTAQLAEPVFDGASRRFELPYPNVAAGLLIAATLATGQPLQAETAKEKTELSQTNGAIPQSNQTNKNQPREHYRPKDDIVTLNGKITSKRTGKAIANAKIMLVTASKQIVAYTSVNGTFSMQIPVELIDDDNVVRITYFEVPRDKKYVISYDRQDIVLTKKQIALPLAVKAQEMSLMLGGMTYYEPTRQPIVLVDGKEVQYEQYLKALDGKKSTFNISNADHLFFDSKEAVAIYGNKAKYGLYIVTKKPARSIR